MARTKPMRVPVEFSIFIRSHSEEFAKQTGLPINDTATMRRMAVNLNGKMRTVGLGFEIALLGRFKKNKRR